MKTPHTPLLDEHLTSPELAQQPYSNFWFVGAFVGTFLLGVFCAFIRPYINTGGMHWEAVVSLIILIVLNAAWLYKIASTLQLHYKRAYVANTLLLWLGFYLGWMVINSRFAEDLAFICGMGVLGGTIVGQLVFYFQNKRRA